MNITLTRPELTALTGRKQAKRIATWLTEHGWIYEMPSGRGKIPAVDRTYYLARMSGKSETTARRNAPRFDRM